MSPSPEPCLLDALPDWLEDRLRRAGRLATMLRLNIYLVGGIVRDLLLGIPNTDVDIVVEGDAIRFALRLARLYKASVKRHTRFGTATLTFPDGTKMDVAGARAERYDAPAALPVVEPSILRYDLKRRDFTINAIAVRLNTEQFGEIVDVFDGQGDLERGRIRILHPRSFIDDPTRLFRAARLEQRLGFKIEEDTERLFHKAVKDGMLDRLSGHRILDQLRLVCEEPAPWPTVERLDALGVFQALHPLLTGTAATKHAFFAVQTWLQSPARHEIANIEPWVLNFVALFSPYAPPVIESMLKRLHPNNRTQDALRAVPVMRRIAKTLAATTRHAASEVYRLLSPVPVDTVLFFGITSDDAAVRTYCRDYLTRLRHIRLSIDGRTLHALGVPQGPAYKRILEAVLYAKLNGEVQNAREERQKAEEIWRSIHE